MKKTLLTLLTLLLLSQTSIAQPPAIRERALITNFSTLQNYTVVEITGEVLKGMSDKLGNIASKIDALLMATTENSSDIENMKLQVADLLSASNLDYKLLVSISGSDKEVKVASRKLFGGVNNNCYLIFSRDSLQGVLVFVMGSIDINNFTDLTSQLGFSVVDLW